MKTLKGPESQGGDGCLLPWVAGRNLSRGCGGDNTGATGDRTWRQEKLHHQLPDGGVEPQERSRGPGAGLCSFWVLSRLMIKDRGIEDKCQVQRQGNRRMGVSLTHSAEL